MHQYSREFISHANGLVTRPNVMRVGEYMTIAEVGFEHFSKDFASIDIQQIREQLRSYEAALSTYVEMKNVEKNIEK